MDKKIVLLKAEILHLCIWNIEQYGTFTLMILFSMQSILDLKMNSEQGARMDLILL